MGTQTITIETKAGLSEVGEDFRALSRENFIRLIQPELEAFQKDFVALGQNPLLGVEATILRTYLAWKLRGLK